MWRRGMHGRAVPPENIHLTLAFIGAWPHVADWPRSQRRRELRRAPQCTSTLDTLGGFRRAGVAWIGAAMPPPGCTLCGIRLATALAAVNVPLDARPLPSASDAGAKVPRPASASNAPVPTHGMSTRLTLMQSQTRSEGARYTSLGPGRSANARRSLTSER